MVGKVHVMSDETAEGRHHFRMAGRANNEDRYFLIAEARRRFACNGIMMRGTIAWIKDGRRSLKDLRAIARRWEVELPSDQQGKNWDLEERN